MTKIDHSIKGMEKHEILIAFSALTSNSFLHLHYDKVDEKNHKSLQKITHLLEDSGFLELAEIVDSQKEFVFFSNSLDAVKAQDFLQEHSVAVAATLYYKGNKNNEAEKLIRDDLPKVDNNPHFGSSLKKIK